MTRLLVVDDSALMRKLMGETFEAAGGFELAFARDGEEALGKLAAFAPDVVTLDVEMPGLGGLDCLDRIMLERPCPVVMVSALTGEGAWATLQALELGAVDVVQKPAGPVSLAMESFAPRLVETVRAAAGARLSPALRLAERIRRRAGVPVKGVAAALPQRPSAALRASMSPKGEAWNGEAGGVVLVGCSTGGPPALEVLLGSLPGDFGWSIVVAQHMPASFTGALARRLDSLCALHVCEVREPAFMEPCRVYIGRGDADVLVSRREGRLLVLPAPGRPEARWRPSVDRLVESALEVAPARRLAGVLMTGMGDDGAAAMTRLNREGGVTLAESEETAVVWGMPGALARAGGAGEIAPLDRLSERLVQALAERQRA